MIINFYYLDLIFIYTKCHVSVCGCLYLVISILTYEFFIVVVFSFPFTPFVPSSTVFNSDVGSTGDSLSFKIVDRRMSFHDGVLGVLSTH